MMRKSLLILLAGVILTGVIACGDDNDEGQKYPDLHTELVEAYTDAAKKVNQIRLDDGTTYALTRSVSSTTADTTLRCVCSFVFDEDELHVTPYSIGMVISNFPIPVSQVREQQSAPYKLISSWTTDRYINAQISYKTRGSGTHQFAFIEDTLCTYTDGTSSAHVSLFHLPPASDMEAYTQKIYVSLPTWLYKEKADTVHLTLEGKDITVCP